MDRQSHAVRELYVVESRYAVGIHESTVKYRYHFAAALETDVVQVVAVKALYLLLSSAVSIVIGL